MANNESQASIGKRGCQTSGANLDLNQEILNDDISLQTTQVDKQNWKGWCEIESDPTFFNAMLKQLGVTGVKVYEIVSFDDEMLQVLPKPAYGLIFLSRWREDTATEPRMEDVQSQGIWFANQTVDNACATLALLNIIYNIPGIELGEHLTQFRDFTASFTPELRGEAVGNFDFIRQVHNSFSRKIDMLNSDLWMSVEATSRAKKNNRYSKQRNMYQEAAYHFDAFVPIQNELWKLDGLKKHPQSLGTTSEPRWLDRVKSDLQDRMMNYAASDIEFAVLGVVRDPLLDLKLQLAQNIQQLRDLENQLTNQCPAWHEILPETMNGAGPGNTLLGPEESYGVCDNMLADVQSQADAVKPITRSTDDLVLSRITLAESQDRIRSLIRQERESNMSDEARCEERKFDYSHIIYDWLSFHVKNASMRSVLEES